MRANYNIINFCKFCGHEYVEIAIIRSYYKLFRPIVVLLKRRYFIGRCHIWFNNWIKASYAYFSSLNLL